MENIPPEDEFSIIKSWNARKLRRTALIEEKKGIDKALDVEIKCIEALEKKIIEKMEDDKIYLVSDGIYITTVKAFGTDSRYIKILKLGEINESI